MPLSAVQYKALITTEVGDVDAFVAGEIDTLWDLYDAQADAYLHYLLTKRKAIDLLMGAVREQVTRQVDGPLTFNLTDKLKNLQVMWGNVDREIRDLPAYLAQTEAELAATTGAPITGAIATTAPITPSFGRDANSLDYRGNPYGVRW